MAKQIVNGVPNYYGPRNRWEGAKGEEGRRSDLREAVVFFAGDSYSTVSFVLPKGATLTGNALLEIQESFVLGGTTPTILVGGPTPATNFIATISQANAQSAAGTVVSLAPGGTLAVNTPLAADTTITITLGGTTPTITAAGKAKLVFQYKLI